MLYRYFDSGTSKYTVTHAKNMRPLFSVFFGSPRFSATDISIFRNKYNWNGLIKLRMSCSSKLLKNSARKIAPDIGKRKIEGAAVYNRFYNFAINRKIIACVNGSLK